MKQKNITVSPMGVYNAPFNYKRFFLNIELNNKRLQKVLPNYSLFRRQFILFSNAYNPATFASTINELAPNIESIYKSSFNAKIESDLSSIAPIDIISPVSSNQLLQTLRTPNKSNRI